MTTPTAPQAQARPGIDSPMVYDDFIGKVSEDEKTWGLYVYHKLRRDRALYIAAKKSVIAKPNDEGLQESSKTFACQDQKTTSQSQGTSFRCRLSPGRTSTHKPLDAFGSQKQKIGTLGQC